MATAVDNLDELVLLGELDVLLGECLLLLCQLWPGNLLETSRALNGTWSPPGRDRVPRIRTMLDFLAEQFAKQPWKI